MIITAWLVVSVKHLASAFSGEGARINGGRWNNKGTSIIYTSGTISLASMEIIVHLPAPALLDQYTTVAVQFDEKLIESLTDLPETWNDRPPSIDTKHIGDRWVAEKRSAVLKVPSVIVPAEHNYLLNPGHPDWKHINIQKPEPFSFDPRLSH